MHTFGGDRICFNAVILQLQQTVNRRSMCMSRTLSPPPTKVHAPWLSRVRAVSWSCQLYVRLQWEPLSLAIAVIATAVTYLAALCWFISFTPHWMDASCLVHTVREWRTAQSTTRSDAELHSERIFCWACVVEPQSTITDFVCSARCLVCLICCYVMLLLLYTLWFFCV